MISMKLIVVTSPATDAGKTFLATGLTETAANYDYKTIYVDLDKPVGDSLRVFGLRHKKDIPTITNYSQYELEDYARTPMGGYVLPKPDNINEKFDANDASNLIKSLSNNKFDIAIIDLGASLEAPFWKSFVEQADLVLLVIDCDDKALYRVEELLNKVYAKPPRGYTLLINDREGKRSHYTPHQIYRTLNSYEEISNIFKIPFFKNLERRTPKTFSAKEKFAEDLLRLALSTQSKEDFKFLDEYIPKEEIKEPETIKQKEIETDFKKDIKLPETKKERKIKEKKEISLDIKQNEPISKETQAPGTKKQIQKQKIKSSEKGVLFFGGLFCKTGYIRDGEFKKVKVNTIEELIQPNIEGIVIPAKWGYEPIKKYRRLSETKTIPLIVLNGDTQHILAGADRITPRISERIIQDVTAYSRQLKIMWETAIICSKTGLPKSEFYHTWFERQKDQKRIFSAAYFDLDKFSAVNDTYGHTVGDIVLYQFAQFLKNNTREQDIAIRWGGEEFVVILPDTNARQGYIMIDRLREMWAEKNIVLPDGQVLKSTFSAGVAQHKEHKGGTDVIDKADNLMYRAKNSGRNKVILSRDAIHTKIIILGNVPTAFLVKQGYQIVTDYKDADCIISDITTLLALPEGIIPQSITLYVLGTGKPSDFKIKRTYFDAMLFSSLEKIVNHIEGIEEEPITKTDEDNNSQALPLVTETKDKTVKDKSSKVTVLPGVRTSKTNLTLPKGGVVFIACPSRPAIASELASKLALSITNVALVCAAPESTAALNIGLTVNDLIESDWRFPRAIAPLHQAGVYVWPVDPYKHTNPITPYDVHRLIEQIKHKFNLVLVDCCGSLSYCSRVAHDEAIMVIKKEGDMSDLATSQWLTNYGGKNVLEVSPIETPIITEAENGLLIDTRSIDCKENS